MASIPPRDRIEAAKEVARRAVRDGFEHVKHGVKEGVLGARTATIDVPPKSEYAHSFVFALVLPFSLLRLAWRDDAARRSIIHRIRVPVVGFLSFAGLLGLHLVHLLPASIDHFVVEIGSALGDIGSAAQSCIPNPATIVTVEKHTDKSSDASSDGGEGDASVNAEEAAEEISEAAEGWIEAAGTLGLIADAGDASAHSVVKHKLTEALSGLSKLEDGGSSRFELRVNSPRHSVGAKPANAPIELDLHKETDKVSDFLSVVGALYALEWILIWIWREHHDAVANEVSAIAGIAAEALPRAPKLRFDLGFVKMKAWRAVRFFFFVFAAMPAGAAIALGFILLGVVAHADTIAEEVSVRFLQAWALGATAYWGGVFGAANAFVAWDKVPDGWEPVFMRMLARPARVPLLGIPVRMYRAFLRRATKNVWPTCLAFEQAPVESAAMTIGKVVCFVPGMYLVLRPFFGPAATHLIAARRPPRIEVPEAPETVGA